MTLRVLKALHAGGVDVSVRLCGGHLGSRERLGRLDPGGTLATPWAEVKVRPQRVGDEGRVRAGWLWKG